MSRTFHHLELLDRSVPAMDSKIVLAVLAALAFPASADGITSGTITAGTGYTSLPSFATDAGGGKIKAVSIKAVTAVPLAAGTGVAIGDTFNPTGGTLKTGGAKTLLTVATAKLLTSALNATGASYAANDVLTLVGGTFSQAAQITVDTVDGSGHVLTSHVSRAGAYSVLPSSFTVSGGAGTGATFNTPTWGALTFTITTAGQYTVPPAVANTLTRLTGTSTGVTATLAHGLGEIDVLNSGAGYTGAAPTFAATGGGGSGASVLGVLGGNGDSMYAEALFGGDAMPSASYAINLSASLDCRVSWKNKANTGFVAVVTPKTASDQVAAGTVDAFAIGG